MPATPSAADFKARYAVFAAVVDNTVTAVIADAVLLCGANWSDADFKAAVLALTAHMLHEEGALGNGRPNAGAVTRKKAGDVELEYDVTSARLRGDDGATFGGTPYGRTYLAIRRRYIGGAVLVA